MIGYEFYAFVHMLTSVDGYYLGGYESYHW